VGAVLESQPKRAERRIRVAAVFFLFTVLFFFQVFQAFEALVI